jgi:hypothetical protein
MLVRSGHAEARPLLRATGPLPHAECATLTLCGGFLVMFHGSLLI